MSGAAFGGPGGPPGEGNAVAAATLSSLAGLEALGSVPGFAWPQPLQPLAPGLSVQQHTQQHVAWQQLQQTAAAAAQQFLPAVAAGGSPPSVLHVAAPPPLQQQGGGCRSQDPLTVAAKQAAAREKNRLAQQRFRERQRAKQKEAGEQCEVVQQEMEQLELENELLERQNRVYEKVLAVRDAMLYTLIKLQPAAGAQQEDQGQVPAGDEQHALTAPAAAAAQGLARALQELPTEQEMEDARPADSPTAADTDAAGAGGELEQQQQQQQKEAAPYDTGTASSGSCSANGQRAEGQQRQQQQQQQQSGAGEGEEAAEEAALPAAAPQSILGEAHRTGTASGLDGRGLEEVELIPPASNQAVLAKIADMNGPDDLLAFVREWQAELSLSYQAAEAIKFDAESVAEVEGVVDRMTEMWWHVGQVRPAWLSALAFTAYPENSGQLPLWREIAAEVLPHMDDNARAMVRRSWHNYCRRLAKAAVGASRWVRRLQLYTVKPMQAMSSHAAQSIELAEITSHLKAAVQEEYIASMEFVAAQFPVTSTLLKAYVNYRSAPWLPDLVAIVWNILALDAEERQGSSLSACAAGAGDASVAQAPPAPALLPAPSAAAAAGAEEQR